VFTGIVEELGSVQVRPGGDGLTIELTCKKVLEGTVLGDSIMVNGACLTVTALSDHGFSADVSAETVAVTTLNNLKNGAKANLERAMALGGRLGGHLVSGHVDGIGRIRSTRKVGKAVEIWLDSPATVLDISVPKGSIAIEGVSLTINKLDEAGFSVMIIPHTGSHTTLLDKVPGDRVNLEADLIGKYVARLTKGYQGGGGLTESDLYKL
jgi:riboflavin synthase